jgi:hypothetical protein
MQNKVRFLGLDISDAVPRCAGTLCAAWVGDGCGGRRPRHVQLQKCRRRQCFAERGQDGD